MKRIPAAHNPNEIWCGGCVQYKFQGLFSDAEKKRTAGTRRCISCQSKRWMHDKTRLILSISTPLFQLFLRGRVVGRQDERLFLFDSYGNYPLCAGRTLSCRVIGQ